MKKIFFLQPLLVLFFYLSNAQNCNNWLYTPSRPSYAQFGQINITGNKITVEATFNRTTAYSGGLLYAGDLVSKHNTPSDVNYLLRPNDAEITTSNGYFRTPDICEIELNKTYHVAMVYDGTTLKFYRNGFLMSQIAATGNLFQNTWKTQVGFYDPQAVNTNFIGYINEVRIWNVAKSQAELKTYMNTSLPNPTTQPGLQAYYTFDNLLNKQGNAAYNGALGGSASINQTNPNCAFIIDSCSTIVNNIGIGGIINDYTPVLAFNPCENKITVEDATKYNVGDTVLMIQMKGAVIDSTNTAAFGTVTDYKNSGNYEFNYVKSKAGNIIELKNELTRQYDIPNGKVQLIRVPYYDNVNIASTLTCLPWDGKKGGVLVLNAKNTITMNADIDVSEKGFRGGRSKNSFFQSLACFQNNYYYPVNSNISAAKGEGIFENGPGIAYGKGANANGGGSGNGHNSGGGGGANGGDGGLGGYQLEACGNAPYDNRGLGGKLISILKDNKIFLGGGGGSGQTDNKNGIDMNGGNGGGIEIIIANEITTNGFKIYANGQKAQTCDNNLNNCHDGSGGGGAGGTILIDCNIFNDNISFNASGGKGGDLVIFNQSTGAGRIGPGGGGGAGVLSIKQPALPSGLTSNLTGGLNGVILQDNNNPWGASPGKNGINIFNLKLPIDTILFKPNIDSVRINDNLTTCVSADFKGLSFTNRSNIQTWQWSFGDNQFASGQNTSHTYNSTGIFKTKLIATDLDGCRDSVVKTINIIMLLVKANEDTSICPAAQVLLSATGAISYKWQPSYGLSDSTISDPIAIPANTTQYIVTGTSASGCTANDTMNIFIKPVPVITKTADTTICKNLPITLFASGGTSYSWSPAATLNNASIATPVASPSTNTTYHVTVTGANNCSKTDSVKVSLQPLPVFGISPDKTTCTNKSVSLAATGGTTYLWSPASTLNNSGISNPVSSADVTTVYTVKIKDKTCNDSATLSATVFVKPAPVITISKSNDIECSLPSAQLTANGADKYVWTPSTGLNNNNIKNPLATIRAPQMYTVTGMDTATGCSATATVTVSIAHPFAPEFFVPNSFSPNGDGRNDCFKITYYGSILSAEILIYNRFGNLVFYTQNINDCWDGTYKGKAQNAGNFVYYLKIKNECMHKEQKGNLVLIR